MTEVSEERSKAKISLLCSGQMVIRTMYRLHKARLKRPLGLLSRAWRVHREACDSAFSWQWQWLHYKYYLALIYDYVTVTCLGRWIRSCIMEISGYLPAWAQKERKLSTDSLARAAATTRAKITWRASNLPLLWAHDLWFVLILTFKATFACAQWHRAA